MPSQGRVSITSTATQILSADTSRRSFWLMNTGGNEVYIGFDSNVSTFNPFLSPSGSFDRNLSRDYKGALWGICATGETSSISYLEL